MTHMKTFRPCWFRHNFQTFHSHSYSNANIRNNCEKNILSLLTTPEDDKLLMSCFPPLSQKCEEKGKGFGRPMDICGPELFSSRERWGSRHPRSIRQSDSMCARHTVKCTCPLSLLSRLLISTGITFVGKIPIGKKYSDFVALHYFSPVGWIWCFLWPHPDCLWFPGQKGSHDKQQVVQTDPGQMPCSLPNTQEVNR